MSPIRVCAAIPAAQAQPRHHRVRSEQSMTSLLMVSELCRARARIPYSLLAPLVASEQTCIQNDMPHLTPASDQCRSANPADTVPDDGVI